MKKLLYILLAVASIGCSKQDDFATQGNDNQAVSFTIIEDETRADHKTSWTSGDEVAIFEGDATTSRKYKVDTSNDTTLVPAEGVTAYVAPSAETTYTVYHPYKDSSEDYVALAEDVIKASTTLSAGNASASLTFSHVNCYITVNTPDITSTVSSITVTDSTGATTATSTATGFYHPAVEDLTGYTITVTADGTDYFTSATTTDITKWVAGTPYTYNIYTSADIIYDSTNKVCEIYTAKGLATFRDIVNTGADASSSFIMGATVSEITSGVTSELYINGKLKAHIDLSSICYADGTSWSPIGTSSIQYKGTFDGNGFEVRNLYISTSTNYQGLFGYTDGATISNLGVTGEVTTSSYNTAYYGGIVGSANSTYITNCYNKATISGDQYSGGIAGEACGGTIENCYNVGSVTGSDNYTGGIVGYTYSSNAIKSCYNIGDISSVKYTGGIVGYSAVSDNTIYDCYNLGNVTAANSHSGGIVGSNMGTLINCYNVGKIISSSTYAGGVVGLNKGTVTNVYNLGSVTGSNYVGGLVGGNGDSGTAATLNIGYNVGEVSGTDNIGNVAGTDYSGNTVSNCYYLSSLTAGNTYGGTAYGGDMTSSDFVTVLNGLAETEADDTICYWKEITSGYPTLDFGNIAQSTD